MDPAPILTMADAVRRACELIPGASTVVEEHIAGLDEVAMSETTGGVLPYSFFTELRLFVFADGAIRRRSRACSSWPRPRWLRRMTWSAVAR